MATVSFLNSKIFLRVSDFWLSRIAVLSNEITGKAGEVIVVYLSFCLAANFDHFTGAGKMVLRIIAWVGQQDPKAASLK